MIISILIAENRCRSSHLGLSGTHFHFSTGDFPAESIVSIPMISFSDNTEKTAIA
jgi:hypothetical protein